MSIYVNEQPSLCIDLSERRYNDPLAAALPPGLANMRILLLEWPVPRIPAACRGCLTRSARYCCDLFAQELLPDLLYGGYLHGHSCIDLHNMVQRCVMHDTGWTCRMGTHPSGPATVEGAEEQTLSSWIAANPSALGSVGPLFGSDIPFLFKVPFHRSPPSA